MADFVKLIKLLPQEIKEIILKEHIKIKIKEREDLGWEEVNKSIINAPFCEINQQIVKCLFCPKCGECGRDDLCNLCKRNGDEHYLNFPTSFENSYYRSWYNSWREGEKDLWRDIIAVTVEKFEPPHIYSIPI